VPQALEVKKFTRKNLLLTTDKNPVRTTRILSPLRTWLSLAAEIRAVSFTLITVREDKAGTTDEVVDKEEAEVTVETTDAVKEKEVISRKNRSST
jgi:hypothetical protein